VLLALGMKGPASAVREGGRHDGVDAPPDEEIARDSHPHGPTCRHQIIQDPMGDVFVVSTLIPIRPKVELERLQLDAKITRSVGDSEGGKVRLPRSGAEARELRTLKADFVASSRSWIRKNLQRSAGLTRQRNLLMEPAL